MRTNKFSEIVYNEDDICDLVMQGIHVPGLEKVLVESDLSIEHLISMLEEPELIPSWHYPENQELGIPEFDAIRQGRWYMPDEYKTLDIASHVLMLCTREDEIQRVGRELLLYHERDLFDLLRYLKYLVDVMREKGVIWGVGRGSSVASYILYLLGVHRVNSLYYDLDPQEFLR